MKKIRLGLIGLGGMGGHHYGSHINNPDVELVAVCDIIPEKVENCLKNWADRGCETKGFTDFKEMIDTMELDAVDICTPNDFHSIIAVYAFEKGLHVFSEKPDAVSVEEAMKMKEASEKAGKVLMVM